VAIGAAITLHANASNIGEKYNWTLPDGAIKASQFEFSACNNICFA
jgi:hypothetical protein